MLKSLQLYIYIFTMAEITNEQDTTKLKLAKFANTQNHTSSMQFSFKQGSLYNMPERGEGISNTNLHIMFRLRQEMTNDGNDERKLLLMGKTL